ncbi:MAG TPA: hypothetical protein VER58_13325 [Thermoanaerobaculia bacterium]|nr:hypothetical protein [Thermoanaerobaculia bacterium]
MSFFKRNAPYLCAAMHVIAGIGAIFLLRGGSEAIPDIQQRIDFMTQFPERWRLGWLLWMLAALTLIGFYGWWGSRIGKLWPVAIAAAGLACDWSGESIFIASIPRPDTRLYRVAALLTGGAGNGLYTVAAMILTLATRQLPWRWLAWCAWAGGIALTTATIINSDMGVTVASAALMIFFVPWVVMAGKKMP